MTCLMGEGSGEEDTSFKKVCAMASLYFFLYLRDKRQPLEMCAYNNAKLKTTYIEYAHTKAHSCNKNHWTGFEHWTGLLDSHIFGFCTF